MLFMCKQRIYLLNKYYSSFAKKIYDRLLICLSIEYSIFYNFYKYTTPSLCPIMDNTDLCVTQLAKYATVYYTRYIYTIYLLDTRYIYTIYPTLDISRLSTRQCS